MRECNATISVIIPCYNCRNYIEHTLRSVQAQTLAPMEIILIDDCSSDDTISVLKSFAKEDSRIKIFANKHNKGVSYSRNYGVNVAKGDWIAFLDSDDQWTSDKLEKQMAMLMENNGVFGFTASAYIDEQGTPYDGILEVPNTVTRKELFRQNVISCSSVLIRRELMARYPMQSDDIHEDFHAWLRILKEVPVAYGLNEPLLIYRLSRNSKSGNKMKSFFMNYKTYRAVGLNPLTSAYNMYWYTKNGLKKYKNIKG